MGYRIGKHEFHTQEEYKAALRDQLRIQSLKREGSTPGEIASSYKHQIREQNIFFETVVGKEFMADLNRQSFQQNVKIGKEKMEKARLEKAEGEETKQAETGKKSKVRKAERRPKPEKHRREKKKKIREKTPLTMGILIKRVSMGLFGALLLAGGLYIGIGMLRDYISVKDVQRLQAMVKEAARAAIENTFAGHETETAGEEGMGSDDLTAAGMTAETASGSGATGSDEVTDPGMDARSRKILPQYLGLYRLNPDLAGWLSIEGTPIDYPVMYLPNDNDYYLKHNFDKTEDRNGLLVLDKRCDPGGFGNQILIHGHNMKSGFMFGTLSKYEEESYYEKHPVIRYDTLYDSREYDIISVFRTTVSEEDTENFRYYEYIRLDDRETFEEFVKSVKETSMYEIPGTASYGDQLIMLSTCDYWKDQGRLVVVGRKR
ncbi:MAG: class B sortase [Lachnospiraceae bacterium]|nr:class B sortase [Lachnospiraceae bacterium]